jgi:hypothetical protein
MVSDPAITYASYLKIDDLLTLQQPRSAGPEHDELLFIIVHQVYELWFKELLHELDRVRKWLEEDESHRAQHTLKRILSIVKVMVAQLDILETMTPLEFLTFRERLEAASGFQSDQFRQIEFVLGLKSPEAIRRFPEDSRARVALERRYREPTLWDAFLRYLSREGYGVPAGGSRRRGAGVALPACEDGGADDWHQARDRRFGRRRLPAGNGRTPALSGSLGDTLAVMTRAVHRLSHRRARELIDQARRDRRDSYPRSTRVCILFWRVE